MFGHPLALPGAGHLPWIHRQPLQSRLRPIALLLALLLAATTFATGGTDLPTMDSRNPLSRPGPEAGVFAREESRLDHANSTKPVVAGVLQVAVQRKLERCHEEALRRIQEVASCRSMFDELGADGVEEIRTAIYLAAPRDQELRLCSVGPVAFTTTGHRRIFLCKRFSRLSDTQAAFVLIHEALHRAGLDESPHGAGNMTSNQISTMVRERCETPTRR